MSLFFKQLVDLQENEKEWLAEHLGHTLNVHKSHYRLQDPIVEMAQLSRLLIAIESGESAQFVGKKLSDINVSGIHFMFLQNRVLLMMFSANIFIVMGTAPKCYRDFPH